MILRGWGVRVVAVGVVMGVLAGCGGDADPVVTPTPTPAPTETAVELSSPTPSPSPTASPSPTELTEEEVLAAIPEAARTEDFFGAQLFAEFFLGLSQEVFVTTDVSLLNALSTADCVFCLNTVNAVSSMVSEDVTARGGELTPEDGLARGGKQQDGDWRVVLDIAITEREFLDTEGSVVDSTQAEEVEVTVVLTRDSDHWRVVDVASQEPTK